MVFDTTGDAEKVLRITETQAPRPGPREVLVQVAARPIQPANLSFIRGRYRVQPGFPQIAGLEGAGVIVEPDTSAVSRGTPVAIRCPGTWAEFAAVPITRVIEIPPDVTDEPACQISLNPVTAWAQLKEAGAQSGDCVLLTAATSTVSNIVSANARLRVIRVIGLVRGNASEATSRCTADHVLSMNRPALLSEIQEVVGGSRVMALAR
jgi:NADPH:quinone reductase-like Zn-dependent oxidoreductase